jgi:hypothetical protein
MGWTVTERRKGESLAAFFRERFRADSPTQRGQLLDLAAVQRTTAYGAYELTDKATNVSRVMAVVVLLRYTNARHGNFAYKDMDESMDPDAIACPRRIFEQLTPLPMAQPGDDAHAGARSWRTRVQRWLETREALRPGVQVTFSPGLALANGTTLRQLRVVQTRPLRFGLLDANVSARFSVQGLDRMMATGRAWLEPTP